MTKQVDRSRLQDIVDHAREAIGYCSSLSEQEFLNDRKTRLAVTYLIQVIGEASSRLSDGTRDAIALPWKDIIGMRNILVHAYHGVDEKILWRSIQHDLPNVISEVEGFLGQVS